MYGINVSVSKNGVQALYDYTLAKEEYDGNLIVLGTYNVEKSVLYITMSLLTDFVLHKGCINT